MSLFALLSDPDWDAPFYKVLARNDTGEATGHQAGIVIPKALRAYFPRLSDAGSFLVPTSDHHISADLYLGTKYLGRVQTRYQFQTWGGTRPAESRLTNELTQLRNRAKGGDVAIFQRRLDDLDHFRVVLVRSSSPEAEEIKSKIGSSHWGILGNLTPVSTSEIEEASTEEEEKESRPLSLFQTDAPKSVAASVKVARSIIFKSRVLALYECACAVCGTGIKSPLGPVAVQAAHIVPRSRFGADDPRNGICLCHTHHWCFDNGLFGVSKERQIVVPHSVASISLNAALTALRGQKIREAKSTSMMASELAFEWHRTNVLLEHAV